MVRSIVTNANRERCNKINPAKKDLDRIDKDLEVLDKKKAKIFEAYEDETITKEDFISRKDNLNCRTTKLEAKKTTITSNSIR